MAKSLLPKTIDPYKFAEHRLKAEGLLSTKSMTRLISVVHPGSLLGPIEVFIEGNIDSECRPYLHGRIKATLPLSCQRCLGEIAFAIDITFCLSPVKSEAEAEHLPSYYDELYVKNGEVSLSGLVEEEILLALPIVSKHGEKDCRVSTSKYEPTQSLLDEVHPFAKLAQLKKHKTNQEN